jgi:uncharacterized protein YoxC
VNLARRDKLRAMYDIIALAVPAIVVILIFVGVELSSIKDQLKTVNENLDTLHDVLVDIRDNTSEEEGDD